MELITKCLFELVGTFVLILLGDGVVACTTLNKSKGLGGGWVVITLGWGLAVMCGVFISGPYSGAHLNPAVTLGLAAAGKFAWAEVLPYIAAQMIGGFLGALAVYLFYKDHFDATEDANTKLGVFCTMPAVTNYARNFFCEALASWLLVFVILVFSTAENTPMVGMGSLGAFPVTCLIMAIGMSLGGATGYAINPARDLAPRIAHAVLPISGKRDSGWAYSWVPVAGPLAGGALAALCFVLMY
jgi:glycerol uptake facilitator protein